MTRLPTDEFAACVGIDWAEAQHEVCLQAAGSQTRELSVREHQPDTIAAWVNTWRPRFKGQPLALCLERNRVPSSPRWVSMTSSYSFPSPPSPARGTGQPSRPAMPRTTRLTPNSSVSSCSRIATNSHPSTPKAPPYVPSNHSANIAVVWSATTYVAPIASPVP